MTDLKTTISGIVTGVAALLAIFNIILPKEVAEIIAAIGVIAVGYFSGDKVAPPK